MRKVRLTLLLSCLNRDLRNRYASYSCLSGILLWFLIPQVLSAQVSEAGFYSIKSDNSIVVSVAAPQLDAKRLKSSVMDGGKVEILFTFRARMVTDNSDTQVLRTKEILLRSTGFRDLITDDFILLMNGSERGTYRSWEPFENALSRLEKYPLEISALDDDIPDLRYRVEVVYKKFVAPLNLLYLIPGRYISRSRWMRIPEGAE